MKILAALLITASIASAQTAYWNNDGFAYTPENFPNALTHDCDMCISIRAQWAAQTSMVQSIVARAEAVVAPQEFDTVRELRTVQVQVKRCNGRRCWYENQTQQQWFNVRVRRKAAAPIVKSKPVPNPPNLLTNTELHSTPQSAVDAIFALLPDGDGKLFFDLGCGDGRLLEAAVAHGYLAIGIELDAKRAEATRKRLTGKLAIIHVGDVRDFNLKDADVVYMWLFPELMDSLDLPETATIISYQHGIASSQRVEIAGEPFFVRRKIK